MSMSICIQWHSPEPTILRFTYSDWSEYVSNPKPINLLTSSNFFSRSYMHLKRKSRSWRTLLLAMTVLGIVAATTTESFAQQPGESSHYTAENVDGQELRTPHTYSEARNGGHLIRVWQGASDNQVWMSFDFGPNFTLGRTVTYTHPTVIPLGSSGFEVFHTGTDGGIYYTTVDIPDTDWDGNTGDVWDGTWQRIPNQSTDMSVSAAPFAPNSFDYYVVYRGSGNDTRVYGTWFDDAGWHFGGNIGGGQALSAPSITLNPRTEHLVVVARGTDNQLWFTGQALGASSWPNWIPMGVNTVAQPNITSNTNGYMVIDVLGTDLHPRYATFDPGMERLTNWTVDTTGFQTFDTVTLTPNNEIIYG